MLESLLSVLHSRYRRLRRLRHMRRPVVDGLLSVRPVSERWGWDRGTPVDRYYIDQFLTEHAADVRGRVLEVKDSGYSVRFDRGVTRMDVLDLDASNPAATIVADLSVGDGIPAGAFDCFVLTQTLQLIYDVRAAIVQCHRLLAPGGVLLVTVPVLSRIVHGDGLEWDYWRFTGASCRRLFGDVFGAQQVTVRTWGNVLAGVAFLRGTAYQEIPRRKLDVHDPYFPMLVTVRAVKEGMRG
jgi:SAM-dependent methyltransferase